jgi:hypothetical protein
MSQVTSLRPTRLPNAAEALSIERLIKDVALGQALRSNLAPLRTLLGGTTCVICVDMTGHALQDMPTPIRPKNVHVAPPQGAAEHVCVVLRLAEHLGVCAQHHVLQR